MPIAGHGYSPSWPVESASRGLLLVAPRGVLLPAPAVATEPASRAREGPAIGCDAPSAVALGGSSRDGDYVVCNGSALSSRVVEGRAGGNLRSFRCYGGSCLPASGHFGQLCQCQLSGYPSIVASIFGSYCSPPPCRCTVITPTTSALHADWLPIYAQP
jgi:hypothetical protein